MSVGADQDMSVGADQDMSVGADAGTGTDTGTGTGAPESPSAATPGGPWSRRDILQIAVLVGLAGALTALWVLTPLGKQFDPQRIADWVAPWKDDPLVPLYVVGGNFLLGLVGFPITITTLAFAILFGPWLGCLYSWLGALAHATTGYWLGRLVTKPTLIEHLDRKGMIRRVLARHGVLSVIVLRNVPIGPFIVVNMLSGASRLRYHVYLLGTAIGILPGVVVVTFGAGSVLAMLRKPGPLTFAALVATITVVVLGTAWLRHRLRHHASDE